MLRYALLCLLPLGLSIYLTIESGPPPNLIALAFSIFVGGAFLLFLARSFQRNYVIIRLNDDGFHQDQTTIPWSAIESFRIYEYYGRYSYSREIGLYLTEAERVLRGWPTPSNDSKLVKQADIVVSKDQVDISVDNLLAILEKYRMYYASQPQT